MFSLTLTNVVVAVSVLATARATCLHGTTFMRRNEGEIPEPQFSYEDVTGPLNWHNLNENNTACNTGDMQSPIVLTADIPFASEAPQWHIGPVQEAEFLNLGTTLEVMLEGAGTLDYAGQQYKLKQFHIHTPSEHRIAREYFPLEVHFVHQADSGDLAVVGIPFDISEDGKTTDLLTSAFKNLADIAEPRTKSKTGPLDFAAVIGAVSAQNLYDYKGSLTTPPCAQGVQFLILDAPLPIDIKTFNAIKKVAKYNSRPTQNVPGSQNILQIAAAATGEDGASGTTSGPVDVDALMQAFFESGKKMKYETVTKVETIVTLVEEGTEQPPVDEPTIPTEPTEPTDPTEPTEPTDPTTPEPTEPGTETPTDSEPTEPPTEGGEAPPADDGNHAPGPAAPPHRAARRSNMVKRRF